ncbi:MAG: hypothetical protein ACI3XL_03020 [Eubacteriales bacterium]
MEYVFEFLLELLLEGGIEIGKSSKTPEYIRYPLFVIISLFFIAVIGLIFFVGILSLKENILLGILLILIGLFMFIMSVVKLRKTYLTIVNKK